jgi:hypothetical protein
MHYRSYRLLSRALVLGALLAGLALPGIASAQTCTVCLSSSGDLYTTYRSPSYSSYSSYSGYASGYGEISSTTGLPRTTYVSGYYRDSGTYVSPYYRSCSYCSYP